MITSSGQIVRLDSKVTVLDPEPVIMEYMQNRGYLTPCLSENTYAYFQKNKQIALRVIPELPFKIAMKLDGETAKKAKTGDDVVYTPAYKTTGIQVDPPFMLVPPPDMRLVFLCGPGQSPHLIGQDTTDGKLYHPIVPNVYETGSICLGHVSLPDASPITLGWNAYMDKIFDVWSQANWNDHLYECCGDGAKDWLRFDDKTGKSVLPEPIQVGDARWINYAKGGQVSMGGLYDDAIAALHETLGGNQPMPKPIKAKKEEEKKTAKVSA